VLERKFTGERYRLLARRAAIRHRLGWQPDFLAETRAIREYRSHLGEWESAAGKTGLTKTPE
jgi:hypothetical protein